MQLFDTFWYPIFFKLEASENPTQKMKHNIKSQVFPKPHPNIPSVLRPLHLSCSWLSFRCFPAYGYRNPPTPQAENKVQDSSSYLNPLVPSPMMDWFFPPFFHRSLTNQGITSTELTNVCDIRVGHEVNLREVVKIMDFLTCGKSWPNHFILSNCKWVVPPVDLNEIRSASPRWCPAK